MKQFKNSLHKVLKNEKLTPTIARLVIESDVKAKAGMFVNVKVKDHYLRRPISISKINENSIEIIYKIKGTGTKALALVQENELIDVLLPLGNGFELVKNKKVLVVGGGIGTFPLLQLIDDLKVNNEVYFLVGLSSQAENIYHDYHPIICTMDDSGDFQGNVVQYLQGNEIDYDCVYACGPMKMLDALQNYVKVDGQISIESRMGCGFGACMGCSIQTKDGLAKRICKEGPVFKLKELDLSEY